MEYVIQKTFYQNSNAWGVQVSPKYGKRVQNDETIQ